eukprot:s2108_g14.t1
MRRLLCALVLACSIVGFEPRAFVGLSPPQLEMLELCDVCSKPPSLPSRRQRRRTSQSQRSYRHRRPGDTWIRIWIRMWSIWIHMDTVSGHSEKAQDPKLVQSNLVRARSLPRLLYLLQGDLEKWNGVNLATAWHRLAKFCQAAGAARRARGSKARNADEPDEQDLQAEAPDFV